MQENPIATIDSPKYGEENDTGHFEKEKTTTNTTLEVTPACFPGTDMTCFAFSGTTKLVMTQEFTDRLRDPGDTNYKRQFPGPQPISIDVKSHFDIIKTGDYMVAPKTDGVRACMVICDTDGIHTISLYDRTLQQPYGVYLTHVPRAMYQGAGTILDGEIVKEKTSGRWVFMIFDCLILCSIPQFHKPFTERLRCVSSALSMAYQESVDDTLRLELKKFIPLETAPMLGKELLDPRFESDGFVYMPVNEGYIFGHHKTFFKLKSTHSVDFLYKEGYLHVFNQTTRRHVRSGILEDTSEEYPNGVIIECVLTGYNSTPSKRQWRPIMVRTDKDKANTLYVLDKTLLNMKEQLSYETVRRLKL